MSHHYSGPNIGFPRGDARLDLTDLYAFPKPGDPGKSILIMNVHPSVGLNPPGPTTSEPFAPEARYELKIDTDGDAVANISYEVRFASVEGGEQTATLRRVEGAQAAETGAGGKVIVERVPVSTGHEGHVTQAGVQNATSTANNLKIRPDTAAASPQHSISRTRRSLKRRAFCPKRTDTIAVPATIRMPPVTCTPDGRSPSTK